MPRASPPQASTDCTAATERALPYPLPDRISARRQATLFPSLTRIAVPPVAAPWSPGGAATRSPSGASGGARTGAKRSSSPAPAGMVRWKSAPSGFAMCSAKKVARDWPVILLTTSPTRNPWVTEWYPASVPGSQRGACRARRVVAPRQSYRSATATGGSNSGRPAVCDSRCRTSTRSLPAAANSGQYLATGASRSRSPRSARISALSATIVLVVDQTLVIVSCSQGSVFFASL